MYPKWVLLVVAIYTGVTNAVRCQDIGWPTGGGWHDETTPDTAAPYPDPFDPQGKWEVYKADECLVRFQTPGDARGGGSSNPMNARMTTTSWTANGDQVFHTMNNFGGSAGNIPLWLVMNTEAFQYAGILQNLGPNALPIVAQSGLNEINTVLSILLPASASAKALQPVHPSQCNENTERALGFGLSGNVLSTDYAYASVAEASMGLINAKMGQKHPNSNYPQWAFMTAAKQDPNECVVIDFRGLNW